MNRPIVFLDFDGVLHPTNYLNFETINGELVLTDDIRFCWAEVLWNLIAKFDCHLVIHSSWRSSYTLQELQYLLPASLAGRVVAITAGDNRYEGILNYVEEAKVKNYIILDDAADEFPSDCSELLLCHGNRGISSQDIQNRVTSFLTRLG